MTKWLPWMWPDGWTSVSQTVLYSPPKLFVQDDACRHATVGTSGIYTALPHRWSDRRGQDGHTEWSSNTTRIHPGMSFLGISHLRNCNGCIHRWLEYEWSIGVDGRKGERVIDKLILEHYWNYWISTILCSLVATCKVHASGKIYEFWIFHLSKESTTVSKHLLCPFILTQHFDDHVWCIQSRAGFKSSQCVFCPCSKHSSRWKRKQAETTFSVCRIGNKILWCHFNRSNLAHTLKH